MTDILHLTKSNLRRKIMVHFFSHPFARLYVREIARLTGVDAGNLSKELSGLEREGLFVSEQKGNQRYFMLNKKYPLYKEMRSIIRKTCNIT